MKSHTGLSSFRLSCERTLSLAALLCFMVNNAITVTDFGINKHFNRFIPAGMKLSAQS